MEKVIHQLNKAFKVFFGIISLSVLVLVVLSPNNIIGIWLTKNWIFLIIVFAFSILFIISILKAPNKRSFKNPYKRSPEEIDFKLIRSFLDK